MGWKNAPEVTNKWASAPEVSPEPSPGEAIGRGAMKGMPNKLLAALLAGAEQQAEVQNPEYIPGTDTLDIPLDAQRFSKSYAGIRTQQQQGAAAAEKAHPVAFGVGEAVPALASMAIPGAGGIKGAAALGGALGVEGSEAEDAGGVATEGAFGAGLGAAGAKLLQLLGKGTAAVGKKLSPGAQAIRDRIMAQIGDRSAAAADATAKAASGTAGAARANASRTVERLGMQEALPAAEVAANKAALATPEAEQLATELAGKARTELPGKLTQMQGAEALAQQAAAEAAAARLPEAVKAMEQQMRREVAGRLLKRYLLPAAGGYALGELTGAPGGGAAGATAGLLFRPGARAILRGVTSPGFTAPLSRLAASAAEKMAGAGGGAEALAPLSEVAEPKLLELLRALREQRSPQLAQNE